MMNNIYAEPLQQGDLIGLVSPSSPITQKELASGIAYLEQKGFKVKLGNSILDADRFLAGKDEDRAKDVMDFFKEPEIKAIIPTRGGQGSQRILPLLDFDIIRKNPKILMGFSDTTALQLGILKKSGLASYTGFSLTLESSNLLEQTFMSCLMGEPYQIIEGTPVLPGIVEAPLIGGNLTLMTTLMGTPYQPEFEGNILIIEDVLVAPYNVDRMLSQLDLAGVFEQVVGIIIGQFENCKSTHSDDNEGAIGDVINEWSTRFNIPCIKDFPYGHGDRNCVLPIGKHVTLDVKKTAVSIV